MKILQISSNDCSGGYWQDLFLGLLDEGHEILVLRFGKHENPRWLSKGLSIDFVNLSHWKDLRVVKRKIKKFKPKIIQGHLYQGNILAMILKIYLRLPFIATRHYSDANWNVSSRVHRCIDKLILMTSSVVLTHSRATRNWLIEKEGVEFNKVQVVYQGFDLDRISRNLINKEVIRRNLGVSKSELLIVTLARFTPAKGYFVLMEAISEVTKSHPELQFRFFGLGNPDWVVSKIESLAISNNCKVVGETKDPYAVMNAADVIIHPSLSESFNQVIVEASILGKPIIATNVAAAPEQIMDKHSGLLVQPGNKEMLITAILRVAADAELRIALGQNAQVKASNQFQVDCMIKEVSALLLDVSRN